MHNSLFQGSITHNAFHIQHIPLPALTLRVTWRVWSHFVSC